MPYNTPFGSQPMIQYGTGQGQMGPADPRSLPVQPQQQTYATGVAPGYGQAGYSMQNSPFGGFFGITPQQMPQQQVAGNPYLGQTSQGIAGVGSVNAPGANNPYLGQTTQQASVSTNPMAGMNNPYLTQAIDAAAGDITRNYNDVINPQFDRMAAASGSFGNTGVEAARGRAMSDVGRQIGNVANSMRMQDYGLQAQLGESAANRATQNSQFNSGLNAGDLNRNLAGFLQGGNQDLQAQMFNMGNQLDTQRFNSTLGANDLGRNASLASALGMFNAGQGNALGQFGASLGQAGNLFNAQAGNSMMENARNREQQQGQFNDTLDYNIYRGNVGDARNAMSDQMSLLSSLFGLNNNAAGTATNMQNTPLNNYMQFLNAAMGAGGVGGTGTQQTNNPYFGNPLLGFLGGMGLFGNLFGGN